jgi:putative transposase
VVVWDNLSTHVSRAMADLIAVREWLTVYRLPPYASGLNPVRRVVSPQEIPGQPGQTRHQPAHRADQDPLRHMQYRPGLLDGSSPEPWLGLTPLRTPQLKIG